MIYCANCLNCKLTRVTVLYGKGYVKRVRCEAGKWKTSAGNEKLHKFFTVVRRTKENCESYIPMGDAESFIENLHTDLPEGDLVFMHDPQPDVDFSLTACERPE
jgi:hypothetical protein